MTHNNYIYIAVMALVSYAIRLLPLTLIRKPIKNRFVQSFLYYVPYVTLAVMTFPAIVQATQSPVAGAVALATLRDAPVYVNWISGAERLLSVLSVPSAGVGVPPGCFLFSSLPVVVSPGLGSFSSPPVVGVSSDLV